MNKLLQLAFVINIIVLTSCTVQNTTTVEKATATASATSNQGSSSASATATVKKTVTTTTDSKDNDKYVSDSGDCGGACTSMLEASNRFSFYSLRYMLDNGESNNMGIAPLGIFCSICQLARFARPPTSEILFKFCGVQRREQIACVLNKWKKNIENQPRGIDYKVFPNYVSVSNNKITKRFTSDVEAYQGGLTLEYNIDDMDPTAILMDVNRVLAKQSMNKLRNAITNSSIFFEDPDASNLVSIIGVYYKAIWDEEFDSDVEIRDYHDMDNSVIRVPYVNQCTVYNYTMCEELDAEFVKIPYAMEFFSSVVIMPRQKCPSALRQLLDKLREPRVFEKCLKNMEPMCINYIAPHYGNINTEIGILDMLKEEGQDFPILDPETANIKNVVDNEMDVYLAGGRIRTVIKNTLSGIKPPNRGCPDNLDGMEKRTFLSDRPVILAIENNCLIRTVAIGVVQKDDE